MDVFPVICPTCFEEFHVPLPSLAEVPAEVDYDCEICCRPLLVIFFEEGGEVRAESRGVHD